MTKCKKKKWNRARETKRECKDNIHHIHSYIYVRMYIGIIMGFCLPNGPHDLMILSVLGTKWPQKAELLEKF